MLWDHCTLVFIALCCIGKGGGKRGKGKGGRVKGEIVGRVKTGGRRRVKCGKGLRVVGKKGSVEKEEGLRVGKGKG